MLFPERVSSRGWAYWLVFMQERRNVPKIKRFREWLIAEMERAVAEDGISAAEAARDAHRQD